MNAADVMVHQVITTGPDSTIRDVAAILIANQISAVPVIGVDGELLGIISEGDLLRRSEIRTQRTHSWWLEWLMSDTLAAEFVKSHSRRVRDVMTRDVVVARADTPLHEIATLLEHNRIKRVPIVQDGKLVGLVSRANLVQAVASWRGDSPPTVLGDVALRNAVMANLEKQPWAHVALINVTAHAGQIDLWGIVDSEAQRAAIRVAVEVIPGVSAVNDNLTIRPVASTS